MLLTSWSFEFSYAGTQECALCAKLLQPPSTPHLLCRAAAGQAGDIQIFGVLRHVKVADTAPRLHVLLQISS